MLGFLKPQFEPQVSRAPKRYFCLSIESIRKYIFSGILLDNISACTNMIIKDRCWLPPPYSSDKDPQTFHGLNLPGSAHADSNPLA